MDEESEAFTRAKNSMSKKKIEKGKELKSDSEDDDDDEEKEDIEQVKLLLQQITQYFPLK